MVAAGEMATVGIGVVPGTEALTAIAPMDTNPIPMVRMDQTIDANPIPAAHMAETMDTNLIPVAHMIEAIDLGLILMVDMVDQVAVMVEDGTTKPTCCMEAAPILDAVGCGLAHTPR